MSQLHFVSELRLDGTHEGQTILVRTGVPQAVTCYRALVVSSGVSEALVVLRNTSRRVGSEPQLAFFLGSTNGKDEFCPHHITSGMSLGFETEHERLITSRVIPGGICLVPQVAVTDRDQMILAATRQLVLDPHLSEYGVLSSELDGCTPLERMQIISTLSGLPKEYRRDAARVIMAAQRSGDRHSFFGALSRHNVLSRLHRIAEGDEG